MALKKLPLAGGTGGRAGSNRYDAPNGVIVTSTANVYSNSNYYYFEYMFNDSKAAGATNYWMTSGTSTYLTFDLRRVTNLFEIKEIKVWPRTRDDSLTNYRIHGSNDGVNWTEIAPWFSNRYSYPYEYHNIHQLSQNYRYIRFNLSYSGQWGTSLNEIEFWYQDTLFLLEDENKIKTYKPVPVKTGGALEFDGTINPYTITTNISMPEEEFTIEQWLAPAGGTTKNMHTFSYAVQGQANEIVLANPTGAFNFNVKNTSFPFTGNSVPEDRFSHVVASWRSNDGYLSLYLNGKLVYETLGIMKGVKIAQDGLLVLGHDQDSFGGTFDVTQAFQGLIGDTRIWNRVLSYGEVQEFYHNNPTGNEQGLLYWWDFAGNVVTGTPLALPVFTAKEMDGYKLSASNIYSATHAEIRAFDRNVSTYWLSLGVPTETNPEWLMIDLGAPKTIIGYGISIWGTTTYNINRHYLQVSDDGVNFRNVYARLNKPLTEALEYAYFPAVTGRYFRVLITQHSGSSGRVSVKDFELVGRGTYIKDKVAQKELNIYNAPIKLNNPYTTKNEWVVVSEGALTEDLFLNEGFILDDFTLDGIGDATPKLFAYSKRAAADGGLTIKEIIVPYPQLIFPVSDIDIRTVQNISWLSIETAMAGTGSVRAIVSFDQGASWLYYDQIDAVWNVVAPEYMNVDDIKYVAMSMSNINSIPSEKWNEIRGTQDTLRVAFYLSVEKSTDIASIDAVKLMFDQFGIWRHHKAAEWKYTSTDLVIKVKESGNYKINYYD